MIKDVMALCRIFLRFLPPDARELSAILRNALSGNYSSGEQLALAIEPLLM
jgi:hypothetical protein